MYVIFYYKIRTYRFKFQSITHYCGLIWAGLPTACLGPGRKKFFALQPVPPPPPPRKDGTAKHIHTKSDSQLQCDGLKGLICVIDS